MNNLRAKILGIGIDTCYIPRFQQLIQKHGDKILKRIFTDQEIDQQPKQKFKQSQYFASRWAVKEATVKALGVSGIGSKCMYLVSSQSLSPPTLKLQGEALKALQNRVSQLNKTDDPIDRSEPLWTAHVSLSHDQDYAVAIVIIEYLL